MKEIRDKLAKLYNAGALHIILGTFVTKFVAFFGSIFVVRLLTKTEYGYVGYVENIYSYALIIAGLGLSYVALRYIVIAEEQQKYTFFCYVINHSLFRNLIIMAFMIVLSFFISYPKGFEQAGKYLPILALLLPLQDMINDCLFSIRSMFKNKQYAYWSIVISVSLIVGRVIGALVDSVAGVLWSRVIINGVFLVFLLPYCIKMFEYRNQKN